MAIHICSYNMHTHVHKHQYTQAVFLACYNIYGLTVCTQLGSVTS